MIQILPTDHPSSVVVRVAGDLSVIQNAAALAALSRMASEHGSVAILADLTDADTLDPAALRESVAAVLASPRMIRTLAVVGSGPWADEVVALARKHTRATVRRFDADARDAARAFVTRPSMIA